MRKKINRALAARDAAQPLTRRHALSFDAYAAARAGLEYGVAQVLAGNGCNGFGLDGFAIGVTCVAQAGVLVPEENQTVRFYAITASAEYGASGSPDYAYRRLTAVVEH